METLLTQVIVSFPRLDRHTHFGMHIYGRPQEIGFSHLGWLLSAVELPQSLALAEADELPEGWDEEAGLPVSNIRANGTRDPTPPASFGSIARCSLRGGASQEARDQPVEQTKLLNPVTTENRMLSRPWERCVSARTICIRISSGYDEGNAERMA